MTDQEINIAIAEACGWKRGAFESPLVGPSVDVFRHDTWVAPSGSVFASPPNYCDDLNAMHSAEETIQGEGADDYYNRYLPFVSGAEEREQGPMDWQKFAHATARQRAEAFLRTLGQWKEASKGKETECQS